MTEPIPVLDEDVKDGMVIGYAQTPSMAAFRLNNWLTLSGCGQLAYYKASDMTWRRTALTFDPDVHTPEDVDAVERLGAWVPLRLVP